MLVNSVVTDDLNSLDMPQGLIELLIKNSVDRERTLKISIDEMAFILNIEIEAAKIIINSVANYSKFMFHDIENLGNSRKKNWDNGHK
jgi:hypothetical protein